MIIALSQLNSTVGDLNGNAELIKDAIRKSKDQADLLVFPEMSLIGYPPKDLVFDSDFIKNAHEVLVDKSKNIFDIVVLIGTVREEGNRLYNTVAVIQSGKIIGFRDKTLLPTYDVFDEKRYFSSGEKPKVVLVPINGEYKKIGVQICEDLWDEDYPCKVSDIQKDLGANLIINISASPYYENRKKERKDYIISKTGQIKLPIIYCNMVGAQDEVIFDGSSCAFTKEGKLIAQCKSFEEDLIMVNLKEDKKIKFSMYNREEEIYRALCLGVNDYFIKTGHAKAVVGLS